MKFDLPQELTSIIKVIGVGGGGGNAVNHMYAQGIRGVDFLICNTDRQALEISPIPNKVQLGEKLTEGLGAGSVPDRGREAVQENLEELRAVLQGRTKMVFITAGMGGGTGTGAAPVIARAAKEMGLLTVGIVTLPFQWEGRKRLLQAKSGIEEMRNSVDTLLIINNDRLRDLYGNLSMDAAFAHADDVLTTAARGIAEIITKTGKVNVDFEDVKTVMTNSGVAIMGMSEAGGEDRALRSAQEALASPLLNDNDIKGAKFVLLNIAHGEREVLMDEIAEITDHIQEAAGSTADVIWGYCKDETLGDKLRITLIATGFNQNPEIGGLSVAAPERVVIPIDAPLPTDVKQPLSNPLGAKAPAAPAPPPAAPEPVVPTLRPELEPFVKEVRAEEAPKVAVEPEAKPLQRELEFVINSSPRVPEAEPQGDERVTHSLYGPEEHAAVPENGATMKDPTSREHEAVQGNRVEERLAKVREITIRLRTPSGLSEMEREPAYLRRNAKLSDAPHSSDNGLSRYTLTEETDETGQKRVELRRNNPFLHDNVD
ncbi:MAG: cell division protein FtsZ [Flavobacteriales bacterium]|nr:cell division protein FtsZ [Flavobacteriales bacterium]